MNKRSESPIQIASEKMKKNVKLLLMSNSSADSRDFDRIYSNLFGANKQVAVTSADITAKILKHAMIPYSSPSNQDKKAQIFRQASQIHTDSIRIALKAQKETEKEILMAKLRLSNKRMRSSIADGQNHALNQRIKKLDFSAKEIAEHNRIIQEKRISQEEERQQTLEKVKQIKEKQKQDLKNIFEEMQTEKLEEKRIIKTLSEMNNLAIKKQKEDTIADNIKKRQSIQNFRMSSKDRLSTLQNSRNMSMRDSQDDIKSKVDDQITNNDKILSQLLEEEHQAEEKRKQKEMEGHRARSELGLFIYKNANSKQSTFNSHYETSQGSRSQFASVMKE